MMSSLTKEPTRTSYVETIFINSLSLGKYSNYAQFKIPRKNMNNKLIKLNTAHYFLTDSLNIQSSNT